MLHISRENIQLFFNAQIVLFKKSVVQAIISSSSMNSKSFFSEIHIAKYVIPTRHPLIAEFEVNMDSFSIDFSIKIDVKAWRMKAVTLANEVAFMIPNVSSSANGSRAFFVAEK